MKKLIAVLVICILIVGGVYYIRGKGYLDASKYFINTGDIKNEEISTNRLQSKNSIYYYNTLSDYEKKIYNKLLDGISKLDKEITLDINTDTDQNEMSGTISSVLGYLFADHPEIWYVNSSYEIKANSYLGVNVIKVSMKYTVSSIAQKNKEVERVEEKIDQIISEKIKNNMTDYEKELAIHDYLAGSIVYYKYTDINDIPDEKHNAYGAIVDKSAVCDGMTKAYQLFLNKLGIENIFVEGTAEGIAHAWNLVKLNGEYYHTDMTSSTTLMGATRNNMPVHVYFNITDSDILETHTIESRNKLPKATATKYNYYKYEQKEITYIDNFDYSLKQIVNNNNNRDLLEIKITGVNSPAEKLIDGLYNLDYNKIKTRRVSKVSYNKALDVYIVLN